MPKKNNKDPLEAVKKQNDEYSKINRGVDRVTDGLLDTSDISSKIDKLNRTFGKKEATENNNTLDILGNDGLNNLPIKDVLFHMFKTKADLGTTDFFNKDIIREAMENLWMLKNMPQLRTGLDNLKTAILSPDDITKNSFIYDKVSGPERVTASDIKDRLVEKYNFEELIEQIVSINQIHGYAIVYHPTYKSIAKDINDFVSARKKFIKESFYDDFEETTDENFIREIMDLMDIKDVDTKTLYSEQDVETITEAYGEEFFNNILTNILPNSPYTNEVKESMVSQVSEYLINDEENKSIKNSLSMRNFMGSYVKVMENERCIPIMINNKLIGIFYLENAGDESYLRRRTLTDLKGAQEFNNHPDQLLFSGNKTKLLNRDINLEDTVRTLIVRNVNGRFLRQNKHMLNTLRDILCVSDNRVKVRFIPSDHVSLISTSRFGGGGLSVGKLQYARSAIIQWILLDKSNMMTELFYKRPKLVASVDIGGLDNDEGSYIMAALDAIGKAYPEPQDLINNLDYVYKQMSHIGRIIIPEVEGKRMVNLDTLQGQVSDDNQELKDKYEEIVSSLIGVPISLKSGNDANFVASIASTDANSARNALREQIKLIPQMTRLANILYNSDYDKEEYVDLKVSLVPPRSLMIDSTGDILSKVQSKIDSIVQALYPDDDGLRNYISTKLTRKYLDGIVDYFELDRWVSEYEKPKEKEENAD